MISLPAGALVGRFRIVRVLGQGSTGIVYLAADPSIERPVALKVLRWESGAEQPDRQEIEVRFLREARLAGRLQHPHIVTIYDVGSDRELYFIAMEYVEGEPLSRAMASALPFERSLSIVRQAAEALGHAHERGVLHRDVKPGNILLSRDGGVKVTDFGIGKLLTAGTSELNKGLILGSPAYMSPEQIREERLDGRSDLFSLAVVLYQLLTGSRPFGGESLTQVLYKILNTEPRDPRDFRPELAPVATEVFSRLLAKSPDARPADAREFLQELNRIADAEPPEGRDVVQRPLATGRRMTPPAATAGPVRSLAGIPNLSRWPVAVLTSFVILAGLLLLLVLRRDPTRAVATKGAPMEKGAGAAPSPLAEAAAPPVRAVATSAPLRPAPPTPGIRRSTQATPARMRVYRTRRLARFAVRPEQARIFVDGELVGIADDWDGWGGGRDFPFSDDGSHRVRVELPGYRSLTLVVRVDPGTSSDTIRIAERLERLSQASYPKLPGLDGWSTGSVQFAVEPAGALVSLGGRRLGAASAFSAGSPLRLTGPKVHDLEISAPGRESRRVRILVASNAGRERTVVKMKLKPAKRSRR
jgi:predicted Ser/Thr protein kinase